MSGSGTIPECGVILVKTQHVGLFLVPTIVTEGAFQVRVFNPPREHGPAHVHVVKSGGSDGETLINLGEPAAPGGAWQPISIRENNGMRKADVVEAFEIVERNRHRLRAAWRKQHG